jgi:hypothetical protein
MTDWSRSAGISSAGRAALAGWLPDVPDDEEGATSSFDLPPHPANTRQNAAVSWAAGHQVCSLMVGLLDDDSSKIKE